MSSRKQQFKINLDHMAMVENQLENGEFVNGRQIAAALRQHKGKQLPDNVLHHVCGLLDGTIKQKRGRKTVKKLAMIQQPCVQRAIYQNILKQARQRKKKLGGFTALGIHHRDNLCQDMAANELAARLTARKAGMGNDGWRSLQNQLSSHK